MVGKEGGKAKPLKKAKKEGKELDETDKEFQKKKKEEAAALKALKEKAGAKGGFAKTKGSNGYLGAQLYARPAMAKVHRYTMVGFAAGFAIMGVARAVT
ncbi:TPA: hypothetical protein ACH3X2_010062 [Trebouxia sp. C0005]|nr:MAG: hypothetical protein FRX49_11426 [Trebouxia sp. A1-2]